MFSGRCAPAGVKAASPFYQTSLRSCHRDESSSPLVLQEHCPRIGMRMHHRLFARRVMDVQHAHRSVLKYHGVMLRVHLDRVLALVTDAPINAATATAENKTLFIFLPPFSLVTAEMAAGFAANSSYCASFSKKGKCQDRGDFPRLHLTRLKLARVPACSPLPWRLYLLSRLSRSLDCYGATSGRVLKLWDTITLEIT
jgi:hypothetical protein